MYGFENLQNWMCIAIKPGKTWKTWKKSPFKKIWEIQEKPVYWKLGKTQGVF